MTPTYTEINTFTGNITRQDSSNLMKFHVDHDGDSFSGYDLTGRIVSFDTGKPSQQRYKIV
jgi:hypothetical protein